MTEREGLLWKELAETYEKAMKRLAAMMEDPKSIDLTSQAFAFGGINAEAKRIKEELGHD